MAVSSSSLILCITGAESCGKSTLAGDLARSLGAPLVPEVARDYLQNRVGYDRADLRAIARQQEAAEQAAVQASDGPVIVADTDLTVIRVWWEERYGAPEPWLEEGLRRRSDRRYLLACPDLPWQPDPLRESPHDRARLHQRYLTLLGDGPFPFAEVRGTGPARLQSAMQHVARWLEPAAI